MKQCSNITSTNSIKILISFALLLSLGFFQIAGAQTDSLHLSIDATTFVSSRNNSVMDLTRLGDITMDLEAMQSFPKILGNSDPLNFVKLLPNVQTNSDYDSGIYINGCDNAHNDISLGGIPVYGASHLLGLFSVFNPSHYKQMRFSTSTDANRLGGMIDMELPDTLQDKVQGDIAVGIMSSQGTLGIRLGNKSHLTISARQSYLNLLYKRWLRIRDSQLGYDFGDYNLTYLYAPGEKDKVWVDMYFGQDNIALDEMSYGFNLNMDWGNLLGALHWEHSGSDLWQKHSVFYSGFHSDVSVFLNGATLEMPSYLRSAGYKGRLRWSDFRTDIDVTLYQAQPQNPVTKDFLNAENNKTKIQNAAEASALFGYSRRFFDRLNVSAWLKGSMYLSPESQMYYGLAPDVTLSFDLYRYGRIRGSYGMRQQYILETGLTNIGFPLDFWLLAGEYTQPQKSQYADIAYEADMLNDMMTFSVGVYGKLLYDQTEYEGDLLDLALSNYDLHEKLLNGNGLNYGLNIMLHKQSGDLTGWISYSLGRALRRFDNPLHPSVYPASHERIHDFSAVCSYKIRKFDISGTFVYATGSPFTAPEAFYITSGQVIADYGEYNGARLSPYARLDLSLTYSFKKKDREENGINFTVCNVLGRRNELGYKLRFTDEGVAYIPDSMPLAFMPSISYFHKF